MKHSDQNSAVSKPQTFCQKMNPLTEIQAVNKSCTNLGFKKFEIAFIYLDQARALFIKKILKFVQICPVGGKITNSGR